MKKENDKPSNEVVVSLKPHTYQPSKAELEKKVKIRTAPDNLAKAMVQNVKIKRSTDAK